MNHYPHHIGDFDKATRHLTRIERSVYRDLIELYYDTEQPLTLDKAALCRKIIARSNEEATAVEQVLNEFFNETATGWYHERCEIEIDRYRANNSQKAQAGKASALKRAANKQLALNEKPTGVGTDVEQTSSGTPTNQNQNQNQNQDKPLSPTALPAAAEETPAAADPLSCPIEKIVELYHQHMPNNPRLRVLNDKRRATIRQRWREAARLEAKPFGFATQADGLLAWAEFFKVCADSDFLTGRAPPSAGRMPFVADLDFLMSPSGFVKCLENKYHRELA